MVEYAATRHSGRCCGSNSRDGILLAATLAADPANTEAMTTRALWLADLLDAYPTEAADGRRP
jgi:hypothetical protein